MHKRTGALWSSFSYWWGRRSLQSRLVAAYIFIILGPCLLVSFYSYRAINNTYVRDAVDKNSYLLQMEKTHILNQIEAMERAAQMAYSDKVIRNYLLNESDPSLGELIDFNTTTFVNLNRIQFNNPNIEHLRLYSRSKEVHEIWPIIFREERVSMEPWYQQALKLQGQELWSFQKNDPDPMQRYTGQAPEGQPKVSLLREISIPAGHHVGMIQVDMLLSRFTPKTYTDVRDNQSQMFITGDGLQLFTRADNSFEEDNPKLNIAITERLRQYAETGEWDVHYKENGNSFLLVHTPLTQIGASLLNVVSMENVMKDISHTRNLIIGLNIGFIVLVTAIAYVLNAFILKNLRRLTETMKRVRRGEAYTGISIRGGGEVGELAHHFSKLMNTINTLVAQAVNKEALSKEAELRTLHNQIDAHFLYNTLENIKMLAEIENQRGISDALTSLGGMMRYNFKWSGEYVKLRDEIRHIENYIEVMNIRFEHPITLELSIAPSYLELEVLKMSLQPIVENSVKHAWSAGAEELQDRSIRIQISEADGEILIAIRDNGFGLSPERLTELHTSIYAKEEPGMAASGSAAGGYRGGGIGLRNVHQRLQLFYGEAYGLEVKSQAGEWTTVFMTLPKVLLTGDRQI
ncbi:histidine kinase [Paenibacillus helianthi]|uniref:histidine kinase n=1 Tax=Paenibacillus helianthi TaxID=1349432 RepID=A0ABX3EN53_9BACL|nr:MULTISPECIES: histidine kinase [Paenibacillus]OKP86533.1 histidine kinase [Paenibacillus helianthi]OKP87225.1 histidine kinase [Paenibacillus sp. P32E]